MLLASWGCREQCRGEIPPLTAEEGLPRPVWLPLEERGGEGRASIASVTTGARAEPRGGVPPVLGPWGDCAYPPAFPLVCTHTHLFLGPRAI